MRIYTNFTKRKYVEEFSKNPIKLESVYNKKNITKNLELKKFQIE